MAVVTPVPTTTGKYKSIQFKSHSADYTLSFDEQNNFDYSVDERLYAELKKLQVIEDTTNNLYYLVNTGTSGIDVT